MRRIASVLLGVLRANGAQCAFVQVLFEPRSKFLVKNVLSVDTAKLLNLSTKIVELEQIIEEDAFNKTSK